MPLNLSLTRSTWVKYPKPSARLSIWTLHHAELKISLSWHQSKETDPYWITKKVLQSSVVRSPSNPKRMINFHITETSADSLTEMLSLLPKWPVNLLVLISSRPTSAQLSWQPTSSGNIDKMPLDNWYNSCLLKSSKCSAFALLQFLVLLVQVYCQHMPECFGVKWSHKNLSLQFFSHAET